ncbi:MAG: hypothetical protein ACRC30_01405 [Clostridium sp.]
MEGKKAFCEVCRDDVEYSAIRETFISEIKGKKYKYIGEKAICSKCKEEIFINEIIDSSLEKLYKEYRYDPIKIHNKEKILELDFSEKVIVDSVIKSFGCYSGKVLEKELIGAYFKEIKKKNQMINPVDIRDYSKKMFDKIVI